MAKYISVEIPTKKYIKAFLIAQYGQRTTLPKNSLAGSKLYDLLTRTSTYDEKEINTRYNTDVKLYLSLTTFYHRGAFLSNANIKIFNLFLESEIKNRFHFYMDFKIELQPSFEANLPYAREKLGIDIEAWDSDSMKKDYYRYRLRTGKPLLYKRGPLKNSLS